MALVLSRKVRDEPVDESTLVLTLPAGFVVPAGGVEILIHTRDGSRPDQVRVETDAPRAVTVKRGEIDPGWRARRAARRGKAVEA